MALPQVQNQGGLGDIAQLLQQLGPLFGTGKTGGSSSSSTSGKAGDLSQTDDLIQQILGGVSDDKLDVLTQNILEKAKQTFAPANISSSAAGIRGYSDTVHSEMQNQAMAKATAEAMSVRLQAQNAAQKTAGGLVESKLQANKTVANQNQSKVGASPAGKALALVTPAALLLNQLKKKSPTQTPQSTDQSTTSGGDNDLNGPYGGDTQQVDTGAGGFPPAQDFGNDSFILNDSLSEIPPPLDFGSDAALPIDGTFADDTVSADAPSEDIPMDIPASDVPADDPSSFSDFNLDDIDFFADGGIVQPGSRKGPSSYDEEAQIRKLINAPSLATNSGSGQPSSILATSAITSGAGRKGKTTAFDPNQLSVDSGDSSPAAALGESVGPAPAGLGLGLSLANAALGLSLGPVGLAVAIGNFLANNQVGVATDSNPVASDIAADNDASIGASMAAMGGNQGTDVNGAIGAVAGDDSDAGLAGNAATAGESGAPAGDAPGGDSPGGDSVGGDTGGDSGDGGGSGDGGEYDGGIEEAANAKESSGIDKKLIHVTPGEAVLPVDTVDALGEDFIEKLIAATHTPLKRRANGRR